MKKHNVNHRRTVGWRTTAALSLLSAAILSVACAGCGKDEQAQGRGRRPGGPNVYIQRIVHKELAPRVTAVGSVTPRRTSIVASGANGVVEHYFVNEGEWVEAGTVLSLLRMESSTRQLNEAKALHEQRKAEFEESKSSRPEEISAALFRMKAAEFAKKTAKERYDRALDAFKKNAISADDLAEIKQQRDQTEKLFQAAEQEHKQLEAGPRQEKRDQAEYRMKAQGEQVGFLEAEHAKRTTRAPFSGYVVKEHSYIGQWLSKGDPVATLARLDHVDIVVNVDQEDIRHVQVGKDVDVAIDGFRLVSITTTDDQSYPKALLESESVESVTLLLPNGRQVTVAKSKIATRQPLSWNGHVVQIVPKSEWQAGSRGFPVKVRVKNWFRYVPVPNGNQLFGIEIRKLPVLNEGMMATVTFTGRKTFAFLVHKDALVRSTRGMKINVFVPAEGEPKDKPKKGSTYQLGVKTGIGDGDLIQVTPRPTNAGEPAELHPNMFVVTEGGERLLPVQGDVIVSDPPSARNQSAGNKSESDKK